MSSNERRALWLWLAFFGVAVVLNGTVPFAAGRDLHAWSDSRLKSALFGVLVYGALFMAGPVVLEKGGAAARRPTVWVPLVLAAAALGLRLLVRPVALVAVASLGYLHARHDLSELGVRLRLRRRDLAAALVLGLAPLALRAFSQQPWNWHLGSALRAGLDRLLLNPASTTENLFYFGFLAQRLHPWSGRWGTPLLVAALYTAHEMTNTEYWYEGMDFRLVFASVAITTWIYSWCRNTVAIWLGSGLARFAAALV